MALKKRIWMTGFSIAAILRASAILRAAAIFIVFGPLSFYAYSSFAYAADTRSKIIPVEVAVIKEKPVRIWKKYSGRLTAVDYIEIRPQASGLITDVRFQDGQLVKKGDILYVIDPRPLKVAVAKAKAILVAARARFDLANNEYERAKNLIETKVISMQVFGERTSEQQVAESTVNSAEAELSQAKINLGYAYVKAPVSGRVSRAEITVGNLVSAGSDAPLLTSIVSSDSIYADFEVDEQTYLRYLAVDSTVKKAELDIPVELRLQRNEKVYEGKIHAFDNRIDPASGTIRARAIFNNPLGNLLPGMYARIKLGSAKKERIILVSERAIGTDQNRKFVYVVNNENKTTYREVQLGDSIDGNRIVRSGLKAGDKVIVRGLMRIRPDMVVDPKETQGVSNVTEPLPKS